MSLTKVIQLAKLLPNHPIEVWDRLATVLEVKTDKKNVQSGDYCPIAWEDILGNLDRTVDPRCSTFAGEPALQAIGALVEDRQRSRSDQGPFRRITTVIHCSGASVMLLPERQNLNS